MATQRAQVPLGTHDQFFIGGKWVKPSTNALFDVIDSGTEELFFRVPEAQPADMERAIVSAREAFDRGPWPRMSHHERAAYLHAFADQLDARTSDYAQIWPRESGIVHALAQARIPSNAGLFRFYADLADTFKFQERMTPAPSPTPGGDYGLLVQEAVGVVGAIIPWNGPLDLATLKIAPALLAGCTVILKVSPEAPGAGYLIAEIAQRIGLPAGVINVLTADREVSEMLVRDPRVDKIAFTGSTAAGRRIGSVCGGRIGRFTLELGGKSAAVILDDADIASAAATLANAECTLTGQVCASLTRIVVQRGKHDEFVDALSSAFSAVRVGDPFDPATQMGPLAHGRQRDQVERYIKTGIDEGARLISGGGRPRHLNRGYYIEPTVFANVDNKSTIAQEEIFGPILSVIPADSEEDAIEIANDSIYGLNAAVFTPDLDRAREVGRRLRAGNICQNNMRMDLIIGIGGFKQSGVGREGGVQGLYPYLESKTMLLDAPPASGGGQEASPVT